MGEISLNENIPKGTAYPPLAVDDYNVIRASKFLRNGIFSRCDLSSVRLFEFLITQMGQLEYTPELKDSSLDFKPRDFYNALGISSNNTISDMEKMLNQLRNINIRVDVPDEDVEGELEYNAFYGTGVISDYKVYNNRRQIKVFINNALLPFFYTLTETSPQFNYLRTPFEVTARLSRLSSKRLYDVLFSSLENNEYPFVLTEMELRARLSLEDSYKQSSEFFRVIKECVDEINEKSDINVILVRTRKKKDTPPTYSFEVALKNPEMLQDILHLSQNDILNLKETVNDIIKENKAHVDPDFYLKFYMLEVQNNPEKYSSFSSFYKAVYGCLWKDEKGLLLK